MSCVQEDLDLPRAAGRGGPSVVSSASELLTSKSLAASLSAPRAPPAETVHRAILMGHASGRRSGDPSLLPWVQPPSTRRRPVRRDTSSHDNCDVQRSGDDRDLQQSANERVLQARLWDRMLRGSRSRIHWPKHPHLMDSTDEWTRGVLGGTLPVRWQHFLRDSGAFRLITDGLVSALVAPSLAVTAPATVRTFLSLSSNSNMRRIQYGSHPMQCVDVFLPSTPNSQFDGEMKRRMIFFVHGGAWGSGRPWMYRLVAEPFRKQGWAVAILGYRTYPDGSANDQRDDCAQAIHRLAEEFPEWRRGKMTAIGHSSGAHILFLLLVHRAEQDWAANELSSDSSLSWVDSFIGLSGPYDISHHFDYEAARGVEELSPMKPSCGYSREGFRHHSPALRLQACLSASVSSTIGKEPSKPIVEFPSTLLLHGIDDTTVPFTATAEAAQVLRACGVFLCEEIYVAETGHQDAVVQLMLGGRTQSLVVDWIRRHDMSRKHERNHDRRQHVVINSKL